MDLEMYDFRVIVLIAACDREGLYKGFCSQLAAFQMLKGGPLRTINEETEGELINSQVQSLLSSSFLYVGC